MSLENPSVLVLSELYPNPVRPAFGIFVERQVYHLQQHCRSLVVCPVRVTPYLRIWKLLPQPRRFVAAWRQWAADLAAIPTQDLVNGVPVYYPRYTSTPKQIVHGAWGFFAYPALVRQLKQLHRENNFDIVHAHYASPCGVIALLAQKWMKVPVVVSVHGMDVTWTALRDPISSLAVRWSLQRADAIIANSKWTRSRVARYVSDPDKIRIVHYGASPPQRVAYAAPPSGKKPSTLLSVGYLEERKGHAIVLRAVAELSRQGYELHYIIVGDGPQRVRLGALARELGIADKVSFEGYRSHAEVWAYFERCDIFALPSWDEAFGIVYIEALSMGKPAIGCVGEGGSADLQALGDCMELVQPRDVGDLARALKRLIESPQRRNALADTGKHIVREHFTWDRNASDTSALYRTVLTATAVRDSTPPSEQIPDRR